MDNELKDKIILPAWKIIKEDSKIKKFYLLPGLLSIIFLTGLLVYQAIYTYVKIIGKNEDEVLKVILNFLETKYGLEVLIGGFIFVGIYIFLTPIFEGGLIKYIDCKNKGKMISSSDAFGQGLYNFLPIFKYNNIFSEFKIISILNFYLFTIRFIGLEYIKQLNYIFLIILILGIIINIMFVYSKYAIILNNKGVFEAIGESSKIAILNIKKTTKLYFLLLGLNIRVIINFILFLIFPIIIVLAISLISTKIILILAVSILSLIFIILILAVGYLTAVLEVFKTSVWYYAYEEGKKSLEE